MIGEALLVTNKDKKRITIGRALLVAQGATIHICQYFRIRNMLAFTDNGSYARHLVQHGFDVREELALEMRVSSG
jgi:hypothetical protein